MPMSEAKKRANKKWNEANLKERYDRIQLVVPKGCKELIQSAAQQTGESVNGLIWRLVKTELDRLGLSVPGQEGQERAGGGSGFSDGISSVE